MLFIIHTHRDKLPHVSRTLISETTLTLFYHILGIYCLERTGGYTKGTLKSKK